MPLRRSESALHDHILVSLSGHIRVSLSGFHSRRQQSKSPPKVPVKTIEAEEKKTKNQLLKILNVKQEMLKKDENVCIHTGVLLST